MAMCESYLRTNYGVYFLNKYSPASQRSLAGVVFCAGASGQSVFPHLGLGAPRHDRGPIRDAARLQCIATVVDKAGEPVPALEHVVDRLDDDRPGFAHCDWMGRRGFHIDSIVSAFSLNTPNAGDWHVATRPVTIV
jgi:hypothetical protein